MPPTEVRRLVLVLFLSLPPSVSLSLSLSCVKHERKILQSMSFTVESLKNNFFLCKSLWFLNGCYLLNLTKLSSPEVPFTLWDAIYLFFFKYSRHIHWKKTSPCMIHMCILLESDKRRLVISLPRCSFANCTDARVFHHFTW